MKFHLNSPFILGSTLLLAGCGGIHPNAPPETACASGVAEILVRDGYLKSVCGCQEAGTLVPTGTPFTCTVPAGTTAIFHFEATLLSHQVMSTGSPSFGSSPPSIPKGFPPVTEYFTTFGVAGNYQFSDSFNSATTGTFIVQ